MNKVVVARQMVGIFGMQVCAGADATDEEILQVCNRENPAGTANGWSTVVRKISDVTSLCPDDKRVEQLPITCEDDKCRKHFLIYC